jgi:molybdate transport system ATP-binding protein
VALAIDIRFAIGGFALEVAQAIPLAGVTALFGQSGSGKSTLLRVIAGLERGGRGRVAFGAETWQDARRFVPPERRGVAVVFQDTRLFPHLSVRGNLDFARRRARGLGGPALDEVVAAFDLGPLLDRRPAALSGGEASRVAIARALLSAPRLLLLDEPLAALDEAKKAEIMPYLERLRDARGVPIVYVSHALAEVARLADGMVVLRGGRVVRSGPAAEVLSDPEAVPSLGVREAGALVSGRVLRHHADGLSEIAVSAGSLLLPRLGAAPGAAVRVRIEAQDVMLAREEPRRISALNVLPGTVAALRRGEGPGVVVQLRCGADLVLARITRRSADALALAPGVPCWAVIKTMAVAQWDIGQVAPAELSTGAGKTDRGGRDNEALAGEITGDHLT